MIFKVERDETLLLIIIGSSGDRVPGAE